MVAINNYNGERVIPRFLTAAFPFMYVGSYIHAHRDAIQRRLTSKHIPLFICIGLGISYTEFIIMGGVIHEVQFSTFILAPAIFCEMLFTDNTKLSIISNLPSKTTLDIYIWHRIVFLLLCMMGISLGKSATVVVFILVLVLSTVIRKSVQCPKTRMNLKRRP